MSRCSEISHLLRRYRADMMKVAAGAAGSALIAVSLGLTAACSSQQDVVSACPMSYSDLHQGVVVSVSGATPTSPTFAYPPPDSWVANVCIEGACMFDSAQSGAPINVSDTSVGTAGPVVVTVAVADSAGAVGPPVTSTVAPTRLVPNGPTCPPTNYVATVMVTPTR